MNMKKEKILIAICVLIITIGTIMAATIGFKFDLRYDKAQRIELQIGKEFDNKEIKNLVEENINGKTVMIQKVEVYEDIVSITAKNITEEEKGKIVEKINEKFSTEIKNEEVQILNIPNNRGRDIVRPYILPLAIATLVIFVYIAIRYRKLVVWKIIAKTLFRVVLAEATLFGIISIARIPVGRLTIPMTLVVYVLTLLSCTTEYEEELKVKIQEEDKKTKAKKQKSK